MAVFPGAHCGPPDSGPAPYMFQEYTYGRFNAPGKSYDFVTDPAAVATLPTYEYLLDDGTLKTAPAGAAFLPGTLLRWERDWTQPPWEAGVDRYSSLAPWVDLNNSSYVSFTAYNASAAQVGFFSDNEPITSASPLTRSVSYTPPANATRVRLTVVYANRLPAYYYPATGLDFRFGTRVRWRGWVHYTPVGRTLMAVV